MPFRLSLFRAAEGVGPLGRWEREHREPLGTRSELRAALDGLLPGLRWTESPGMLFGSGPFNGEEHAFEISLYGAPDAMLLDISVYGRPPVVRAIMSGLGLNHCYAQESDALCFPFDAGEDWARSSALPSGQ